MDTQFSDQIIQPAHYAQYAVEPIEFIMVNDMDFWRGNVIKYVSRAGSKMYDGQDEIQSEITDLCKAIRYCEMRINMLNEEGIL